MNCDYTHIVLGSSPLSLAEAICLQLSGNKVLVIENGSAYGGSWQTIQTKKFVDMETGCHIMYRNSSAYNFIEDKFGIKMPASMPQPRIIRYNSNANYKFTNFWDVIDVAIGVHLKKGEIRTLLAYVKRAIIEIFNQGKFRYPEGGSKVLVEKLVAKSKQCGVVFESHLVDEIYLKNNTVEVKLNQQVITSNHLILTPNTKLKKIISDSQTFEISKAEKRSVANMFLLIEQSPKQMLSYIGVKKHKIFRIADMTYNNSHYLQKGQRVLCAQIRVEYLKNEEDAAILKDEVIAYLKKFKLVNENMILKDWELYYYDYYHRHESFLKELPSSYSNNIQILRSHNFTISMAEIAKRWKNKLPS